MGATRVRVSQPWASGAGVGENGARLEDQDEAIAVKNWWVSLGAIGYSGAVELALIADIDRSTRWARTGLHVFAI